VTDYTWPSAVHPSRSSLTWEDNTVVFESPISNSIRTVERAGGRWVLSIVMIGLANRPQNKIQTIEAFAFKLNGRVNRAIVPDPGYVRTGPGGGTPVVSGAGQTGYSLVTSGWPNSTTVLYAGDRIGVSNQMIPIASNVTSNGSGVATITLCHPIRTAPTNGSAVEIDAPAARYFLSDFVNLEARPGLNKTIQMTFTEAIP
jgi:hypothetical protein